MADDLRRRAHALLREVVAVAPPERAACIDRLCAADESLRRRLRQLVDALETSSGFLESPALGEHARGPVAEPASPADARVPGYRVLGVIGAGGMATVYEAVQESTRRRVALKVLRRGLTATDAISRFRFETEVLARLRHPGIAQIFDAGVCDDGRGAPYFAMEHIEQARPITEYAEARGLGLRDRLSLVASVCDAVQHGHQSGVIHRDLKPSNVLVDHAGAPKVIDFGVARSTDPDQTLITEEADLGALIGTLHYMSPEQCAGRDIDVRTDVYSLGVILYELVVGRRPHDLTGAPLPKAMRVIADEAPPRPSAVRPELKGDIEAIILMALDKDPDRRYRTPGALATDIRRHLRYETIEARPMSFGDQCRLFARRNRRAVVIGAIVAAALVIDLAATSVFAWRASREADRRRAAEAIAIADRDRALWQAYVANIAAALSGFQSGEFAIMRQRLADAPERHRDWEWRLLASFAERSLATIEAHDDMIFGFTMSDDGARLATGSRDGQFRVWDGAQPGLVLAEGGDPEAPIFALDLNNPPTLLATGDGRGRLRLWDAASGAPVRDLATFGGFVESVAFGAGDVVGGAARGEPARLFDAATGATLAVIDDHPAGVAGLAFSCDGDRLVTWDESGRIVLRDGATGAALRTLTFRGEAISGAFSADGARLAIGGAMGRAMVWEVASGALVYDLKAPGRITGVRAIAFSPDGRLLAAGLGADRTVVLWNLDDGSLGPMRRGHTEGISGLAFSADGARLVSSSWDRTLRTWEIGPGEPAELVPVLWGHTDRVINVEFSPDGRLLASSSVDGAVRLWDGELLTPLGAVRGHDGPVYGLAFSPDGERIATGGHDDLVRIWSARTGAEEVTLSGHTGDVWSVAFSPDGTRIASAGGDRTICIWDGATGALITTLTGHSERVNTIAFSPDGAVIASGSRDQSVRLWDGRSGAPIRTLNGHESDVFSLRFSDDGATLYSGARDQSVRVWRVADGAPVDVLDGHGQFVTSLAMRPDGARLAAGSWFGEIVLWDVPTRTIVASFKGHEDAIRDVAFDPTGARLVTASHDGTLRVFDETPEAERVRRREASRPLQETARAMIDERLAAGATIEQLAIGLDHAETVDGELMPRLRTALLRRALER